MITNIDVSQWTMAPLQLATTHLLDVEMGIIFQALSDPNHLCQLFPWMQQIEVDNTAAQTPNGLGAKRRCHFGNGLVLEETIVGWWPPNGYAYRSTDEAHPIWHARSSGSHLG